MADAYGLDDVSMLSGPNANMARQVQQAFMNSMQSRDRQAARYSLPTLANFGEDTALARAQTAAGLINQNQQLQDVIDASKATPHGIAQNLSAYLPLLGLGNSLASTLFGRSGGGALAERGLVGLGQDAWNKIVHPASGTAYTINPDGTIGGPGAGAEGGGWGSAGLWGNYNNGADMGPVAPAVDWWSGAGSGVDAGSDLAGFGLSDIGDWLG